MYLLKSLIILLYYNEQSIIIWTIYLAISKPQIGIVCDNLKNGTISVLYRYEL